MAEKTVRNMFAGLMDSRETESKIKIDPNPPSLINAEFGDWILCSESLPAMHESNNMLAKSGVKQVSDICITTIYDGQKYHVDTNCRLQDGEWQSEKIRLFIALNKKYEVIAWMPLPKPYTPK